MIKFKVKVNGPKRIDLPFEFNCPTCGRTIKLKIRDIHPGREIYCECGTNIRFSGDDLRKIQKEFDDLINAFRKLGK